MQLRAFQLVDQPAPQLGRVLILGNDPAMRQKIVDYLDDQNCLTIASGDVSSIRKHVDSGAFSLIILDVHLGRQGGFDVLRQIRELSDIPVIIINGQRHDEVDTVVGLELGADDYLTMPLNLRELLARARATLRRQEMGRLAFGIPQQRGGYRFLGWELRRKMRTLTDPQGRDVPLTKGEYALLVALLDAPGRSLAREQLLRATRTQEDIFDRSIDVQVLRLRRKLEADPACPAMIRTERGIGYVFNAPVERLF